MPAGWFSAMLLADRAMSVGVSLTLVTLIVKAFSKDSPPCVGGPHADAVAGLGLVVEDRGRLAGCCPTMVKEALSVLPVPATRV